MKKITDLISYPFLYVLTVLFMMILLFSCSHESKIIDDIPEICFESMVLPIFQNSCALSGCHDQITAESGLILDNYQGILESVSPGDPKSSESYTSLLKIWSDDLMPPSEALSLENRTIIRVWIEQGANETTCNDTSAIPFGTVHFTNAEIGGFQVLLNSAETLIENGFQNN